jgi:cell division transport system permease protein
MRLQFILSEIWTGVRRNLSMTVSVTLVTMVSVLFIGFGLLAQRQVDTMKDYWYDRVQVSIFLCTAKSNQPNCAAGPVTAAQRQQIATQLDSMKPLVKGVFTETQAQAYSRFKDQFKDSPVLDDIKPADLPESFRVQLSDPTKYAVITSSFTGAPGVGEVQDQQRILDPLFTWLNKFTIGTWVMAALMVVCSVLLVATTIRQTAFSRRRETGIMRLVGASAFVIQLPFILETLLATLLGAGLGFGALWAAIRFGITENVAKSIPITFVTTHDVVSIAPVLVGGGAVVAMATAWLTLRRYLRV